jgi:hypothetical protein
MLTLLDWTPIMITAQVILLYFLPGCGVAVALYLSERRAGQGEKIYVVLSAILFWPIYLPGLLYAPSLGSASFAPASGKNQDALDLAIHQVDEDLSRALAGLEGWANAALSPETHRIQELRSAWTGLAERIREMDRVLATPDATTQIDLLPESSEAELSAAARTRLLHSMEIRRQNLDRLRNVRRRAYEDLMSTMAWVRELISMIHLARFTGAPAARVQELVGQIASAVEALGEVSLEEFPEDGPAPSPGTVCRAEETNLTSASSACLRETFPAPGP